MHLQGGAAGNPKPRQWYPHLPSYENTRASYCLVGYLEGQGDLVSRLITPMPYNPCSNPSYPDS